MLYLFIAIILLLIFLSILVITNKNETPLKRIIAVFFIIYLLKTLFIS